MPVRERIYVGAGGNIVPSHMKNDPGVKSYVREQEVVDLEAEVERLRGAFDTAVAEATAGNRDSMMYALRNLHGDALAEAYVRIDAR